MLCYLGLPIGGVDGGKDSPYLPQVLRGRDAFVSFAHPCQLDVALASCRTIAVDNGAFSLWRNGGKDYTDAMAESYMEWVGELAREPNFAFAVVPDSITGTERRNDELAFEVWDRGLPGVPVWHLHEPIDRLRALINAEGFAGVAFGSSGRYAKPCTLSWWYRMKEAFDAICDEEGRPPCKLHGLRMMDPRITETFPFSSVDSTNVGRSARRIPDYRRGLTVKQNALWIAEDAQRGIPARRWRGLIPEHAGHDKSRAKAASQAALMLY